MTVSGYGINATATVNYTDSFKNDRSSLKTRVSSHTTMDLNISVSFNNQLNVSPDYRNSITLTALNIFNNDPPFADNTIGFDTSNADALGRILSFELKIAL